jgi:hypothetical protein
MKVIKVLLAAAAATSAFAISPVVPAFAASNQCPETIITVHTTTDGEWAGGSELKVVSPNNPPIGNWCKVTVQGMSGYYYTYNHNNNTTAGVFYELSSTDSPPPQKPTPVIFPDGSVTFTTVLN